MSCPDLYDGGNDLSGLLTSFTANYSMYGDFSASAVLANQGCVLGVDTIGGSCTPVYATIRATAEGLTDVVTDDNLKNCYSDSVRWIAGLLTSFSEAQDGVSSEVPISIQSYHNRLVSKPITSYSFSSNSISALNQVITYFAGIPNNMYSVQGTANPILGSFSGGNVWDAIKTLAQLSQASAYVQVGGVLEIRPWKDHTSAVELSIPGELISSVTKSATKLAPRLAVKATGASFTVAGCGERIVSDSRSSTSEGGYSNSPGPSQQVVLSGINTDNVKSVLANLQANRDALKEAKVLTPNNFEIDRLIGDDGNVKFVIRMTDGVIGPNGREVDLAVIAAWARNNPRLLRKALRSAKDDIARLRQDQLEFRQTLAKGLAGEGPSYFPASNKGGPAGGPGDKYQSRTNSEGNESSNTQLDVYAFNDTVGWGCGQSYEQIDNPLCNSRDTLFKLAVRRHQEMLLDNNTMNVELGGYLPCVKLNQVIEFPSPGTSDCPPRLIKGLVTEINLTYNAKEQTTMRLAVSDLGVLGQSTYRSSNLIDWQCGGGSNAIADNPWEASALSLDSSSNVQDGVVTLFAKPGTGLTYAYLNQFLTPLASYTLSFQYEAKFGSSPLFFNNGAGGGATLLGPVGTYTENFVAAVGTPQFQWSMLNPANRSLWRIYNIQLTRTVIA